MQLVTETTVCSLRSLCMAMVDSTSASFLTKGNRFFSTRLCTEMFHTLEVCHNPNCSGHDGHQWKTSLDLVGHEPRKQMDSMPTRMANWYIRVGFTPRYYISILKTNSMFEHDKMSLLLFSNLCTFPSLLRIFQNECSYFLNVHSFSLLSFPNLCLELSRKPDIVYARNTHLFPFFFNTLMNKGHSYRNCRIWLSWNCKPCISSSTKAKFNIMHVFLKHHAVNVHYGCCGHGSSFCDPGSFGDSSKCSEVRVHELVGGLKLVFQNMTLPFQHPKKNLENNTFF